MSLPSSGSGWQFCRQAEGVAAGGIEIAVNGADGGAKAHPEISIEASSRNNFAISQTLNDFGELLLICPRTICNCFCFCICGQGALLRSLKFLTECVSSFVLFSGVMGLDAISARLIAQVIGPSRHRSQGGENPK